MSHPVVSMTKARASAWERNATDEDFYKYVREMAQIYARRKYKGDGELVDPNQLFIDYREWKDELIKELADKT